MVNWGNLHIFADSPFINIYQILNILKNYYPLRGYWRRVNNTSQGHFQVVYPHRAVREKWRVILRGIKIAISISKPKKKRNFEKKRNKIKQENKVKEDNKETQINTLDASNEIIESETEYILDKSSGNESEEIDEPNVSVKLTDTKELTQEETICYKNLDSHNWLKTPLILKAQYENSPIKNEEKFQVISNQIEEIITEELKILPKKKIGEADLREFLSKSINYSYKRSFQKYNPYTKKQMKPFQDKIIKKFINKEWEIDSNLKQTIKYKNSKDYTEMNTKKITKIRNSNKIIIQRSFLNIFETLSIINNQYVYRIIQKGEHQMEIWDKNQMINSIFQNCKQKQENIPTKTKIHLINANGDKIETVKGKQEMNDNEYTTNIGSININGLIRLGKTQELEQILLEQKIEIALIQESHLKKRIYFQKYFTFEKEAYGQKKSKGGIAIAVRKEIRKYFHEIPNEDSDILHLKISDMNIITVYIRNKRQNELMKKLQEIIQNLNGEKFIIGGDFNLTEEEINKRKLLPNVVIIPNPENSRTRNIDHFCVNEGIITQPSKIFDTISRKLSDHKLIITSIRIKIPQITTLQYYQPTREEFQIKLLKKVEEETEIGDKLILKPSIIQNLKENFKKRVIVHTETQDKIGFELLNFTQQEKPNWKKMLRKKWKKTIKGIEMDKMNEINYWTEIQRLTQKKKPIKTDPEMRERFKRMIEEIRRHPTETIIQKIKNYEIDIPEDVRKPSLIFPLERLNQTIKMSKNSATCEYDKIDLYKNPYIEENTEKYEEIIKLINRMYKKWIKNPDETTINYLRKRRMIFIFKQGDAESINNYRSISINNALARIFLKRILEEIEQIWDHITPRQMGFRRGLDTRISVLELKKNIKRLKKGWIISIDIKKCFDTIDYKIIRTVVKKFIRNEYIKNFLMKYYEGEGCGIYQGDPLSPIIFGMISHFIIEEINPLVSHIQMYADDLIVIIDKKREITEQTIQSIYQILREYGLEPNEDKTKMSKQLKEIKYLGIILDSKAHTMNNIEKAKNTFKKLFTIMTPQINNQLKITIYKVAIIPQILYGTETHELSSQEYKQIDTLMNSQMTQILRVNRHTPVMTYRNETNTPDIRTQINMRKWKLRKKLTEMKKEDLKEYCIIDSNNKEKEDNIWETNDKKYLQNYLMIQRIEQMRNSESWKTREYYQIIKDEPKLLKIKNYLNYDQSSIILKLRTFTNGLNRYSHDMKNTSKMCPCCLTSEENLSHFLWECEEYSQIRMKWMKEIGSIKDSITLMREIQKKGIFEKTMKYIKEAYKIRSEFIEKEGNENEKKSESEENKELHRTNNNNNNNNNYIEEEMSSELDQGKEDENEWISLEESDEEHNYETQEKCENQNENQKHNEYPSIEECEYNSPYISENECEELEVNLKEKEEYISPYVSECDYECEYESNDETDIKEEKGKWETKESRNIKKILRKRKNHKKNEKDKKSKLKKEILIKNLNSQSGSESESEEDSDSDFVPESEKEEDDSDGQYSEVSDELDWYQ